jgi:hypothetical protein
MAWVHHVKLPLTVGVLTAAAGMLVAQVWLWPLWRQRRQLLARYVEPELVQLRDDLLNLSAVQAALQLDIHQEAYANRIIVEAVAARCRAAGVSAARQATARMAASLLTFQRTNMLKDPIYDPDTSWEALTEEAAAEIDKMMALTAWQKAMRESYVSQDVYILMFLVLDSPAYWEQLLIDERPGSRPGTRRWRTHRDGHARARTIDLRPSPRAAIRTGKPSGPIRTSRFRGSCCA